MIMMMMIMMVVMMMMLSKAVTLWVSRSSLSLIHPSIFQHNQSIEFARES